MYILALAVSFGGVAKTSADLVGYWPLNGDALDAGENGLHGTLVGDVVPTENRNGNPNSAMLFTGDADCYVDLGDHEEFRITGAMTVAAWVRLDSDNANNGRIVAKQAGGGSRAWSLNIEATSGCVINPGTFQIASNGNTIVGINDQDSLPADEWVHLAGVYKPGEALELYVNGELKVRNTSGVPAAQFSDNGNSVLIGSRHAASNCGWLGAIDEVQLYNIALSASEIKNLMSRRLISFPKARVPSPADGALIEGTWANLSWSPGDFAVSHDVYIGDNFDDVNNSTEGTFIGNQSDTFIVVGFPGFPFPDSLMSGTTYYWRIDEVNEAEPNSPWKGDVWSFSIPPKTAYFPDPADGAESVDVDVQLSWTAGFGSKLHTVYFGETFEEVDIAIGGQAQGGTTYTPGTLKIARTYYWRVDEFDVVDTHKGDTWSFTTEGAVGGPSPANGAVDVTQTPVLTWVPGVFADTHEVYFGVDSSSLELKGSGNLGSESFESEQLEWNTTYYWRIDEANNANADSPWTGPLWSFTTANFLIIDDMESYNDLDESDPA
ncbi:MAG: LamG domain-containing protein, partial [Sedimentisphaerales bacterium]|nr:LamG domain-containing protein [Sedimentisphaerales bacterium]